MCSKEKDEMKEEMERHEKLMELMEKRFDEQHAKVMVNLSSFFHHFIYLTTLFVTGGA